MQWRRVVKGLVSGHLSLCGRSFSCVFEVGVSSFPVGRRAFDLGFSSGVFALLSLCFGPCGSEVARFVCGSGSGSVLESSGKLQWLIGRFTRRLLRLFLKICEAFALFF
ncbi:unnamed protein product [Microthlaspi erraticum]|uniref:Uncharacterized protein n=1 Tax=Microthlaspi erraticum TaxID=1685480 RepID=A0A6D2JRY8_9BRAS|nr:unnamed protein product [Microthlaspi erraticum]CAA7039427.1 unnamed protein product [Microthlaspi erraticum]